MPPAAEVEQWYARALTSGARLAVASDGDEVLGHGLWSRHTYSVAVRNAELRKLMVHPSARGRGVARLVAAALVEDARAAGVEVMTLDCRGNNHAALSLYASLGFVVTGRRPDFIAVADDRFDQVLMHLDFRADLRTGPEGLVRHGSRREGPGATP